jgi:hypothetical protein
MIDCANLRMKQGRGDDYIPVSLTSSNNGWHKGCFYLRNDPEYTWNSITESRRNWSDGLAKAEQEKILKDHWAVLRRLRGAGVTLSEILRQYHAREVVPHRLYEMAADRAPWTGTMTAPSLPSPLEVQRRVAQAIGRLTYSLPPARLHPMLPHEGIEKFARHRLLDTSCLFCVLCCDVDLLRDLLLRLTTLPSCCCS